MGFTLLTIFNKIFCTIFTITIENGLSIYYHFFLAHRDQISLLMLFAGFLFSVENQNKSVLRAIYYRINPAIGSQLHSNIQMANDHQPRYAFSPVEIDFAVCRRGKNFPTAVCPRQCKTKRCYVHTNSSKNRCVSINNKSLLALPTLPCEAREYECLSIHIQNKYWQRQQQRQQQRLTLNSHRLYACAEWQCLLSNSKFFVPHQIKILLPVKRKIRKPISFMTFYCHFYFVLRKEKSYMKTFQPTYSTYAFVRVYYLANIIWKQYKSLCRGCLLLW